MPVDPGTKLGPYEITAPLGAGGMGEVYRARDTRLGREVAIKVLPQHLSANLEVRARFEREAKTVSSLNHPHICTLHDVGREGDTDYLVMELVEGETLAQRLIKGALPTVDVLKLGAQIADALDRAHRAGVIHRDLKPSNVMLTKSGAKLMDFGLARATGLAGPSGSGVSIAMTQSPTVAQPLTAEGTIVGTFQYMSPEQLEGKEADARSDIWALGCVLYEMATGRRAFTGASQASLIGAIMNAEPRPLSEVAPMAPPGLERLVRQCLVKDPDDRWQSARDLGRELGAIASDAGGARAAAAPAWRRSVTPERVGWVALVVLAAVGTAYLFRGDRSATVGHVVSSIAAPPGTSLSARQGPMAFSADGRQLAFVAEDSTGTALLWVRALDAAAPRPLPGTEGASSPFWSPDGRNLGFLADGKLKRIDATGGAPQVLADAPRGLGGTWSRTGFILFIPSPRSFVMRVPAAGGASAPVPDSLDVGLTFGRAWPVLLPDDRHFLFVYDGGTKEKEQEGLYLGAVDRPGETRLLVPKAKNAAFAGPGRIFFWRDGALWAQTFDARALRTRGEAVRVADRVVIDSWLGCGLFSASPSGPLAYLQGSSAQLSELVWVDRAGREISSVAPPASYYAPRLSHDGRRVAIDRSDPVSGQGDIWIFDLARKVGDRVTSDPANESSPVWSPNDDRLYWMSAVGAKGLADIHSRLLSGTNREQTLFRYDGLAAPLDCSPDGRWLLFATRNPMVGNLGDLWVLSLADGKASPFLATTFDEGRARLSRDGRWIAYTSDESGQPEVYVQRFPQGADKWRVSTAGGMSPVWRADGRELFYLVRDRQVMSVSFRAEPSVEIGVPVALFRAEFRPTSRTSEFDATPDGQRFLIDRMLRSEISTNITLDQGWSPPR